MTLGFRILPSPVPLSDDLVAQFRGLSSANLADAMGRFNFMEPAIQSRSTCVSPAESGAPAGILPATTAASAADAFADAVA